MTSMSARSISIPARRDFDGDGAGDACDDDDDNDGMFDGEEFLNGTDPLDPDTDDDGVLDGQDICPTSPDPGQEDADGDNLGNVCDLDDDNDGLFDPDEAAHGTNPFDPDSEDDGLRDGFEVARGTNPLASDTDGDGVSDLVEVRKGMDPLDTDSDGDGSRRRRRQLPAARESRPAGSGRRWHRQRL